MMQVIRSVGRHLAGNAVGYVALLVATSGTAYAAATVGSGDVVDNSLRSIDVRNDTARGGGLKAADLRAGSVGSSEVKDGSLTQKDLAPSADGAPDETAEWSVDFTETGETVAAVESSDTFARGTLVEALDGRLTGDFGACTNEMHVTVSLTGGGSATPLIEFSSNSGSGQSLPTHVDAAGDVTEVAPRGLIVVARCVAINAESDGFIEVPVPSFDLSVTFQSTDLTAKAPTADFQ